MTIERLPDISINHPDIPIGKRFDLEARTRVFQGGHVEVMVSGDPKVILAVPDAVIANLVRASIRKEIPGG